MVGLGPKRQHHVSYHLGRKTFRRPPRSACGIIVREAPIKVRNIAWLTQTVLLGSLKTFKLLNPNSSTPSNAPDQKAPLDLPNSTTAWGSAPKIRPAA